MSSPVFSEPVTLFDRESWLDRRRKFIGASEAPAAVGVSPWETPLGLYLRKTGEIPDTEESEAMRWGHLLEPVIAEEYTRRTGRKVAQQQVWVTNEKYPHLAATLDGLTDDGPLEIKTVGHHTAKELGEEGTDAIPEHWIVQAHQQMAVTTAERVDFAVLVGGQALKLFRVEKNDALMGVLLDRLATFWGRVERRDPPEPDYRQDAPLIASLYKGCEGAIELDELDATMWEEYAALGSEMKRAGDRRSELKAQMLARLGDHAAGLLPDGRQITRRLVHVEGRVQTVKAYTYADLRIKKGQR
jgi:putative phage-type endonuclease